MCTSCWQRARSSFVRPDCSGPMSTATRFSRQALPDRRGRLARIDDRQRDGPQARARADDPAAIGDRARELVVHRRARAGCRRRPPRAPSPRRSENASAARARARVSPIVFIARAVAPMLPGCEVSTSTMRTGMCTAVSVRGARRCAGLPSDRRLFYAARPMHGMVNIAVRAARRAGEIMVRHMNQLEALKVVEKSRNEFVSQVDQAAEAAIIEVIKRSLPRARDPGRGERRGRRARVPVDHRSARRHDELLCTASRSSRCRSASRAKASSSTASSTTRCGRRSSRRAAAKARSSTGGAFASASARRSSSR